MDRNSYGTKNKFLYVKECQDKGKALITFGGINWSYAFGTNWSDHDPFRPKVITKNFPSLLDGGFVQSQFTRVGLNNQYRLFLRFMPELLSVADSSWGSDYLPELVDIPCIAVTPSKFSWQGHRLDDYINSSAYKDVISSDTVKLNFYNLIDYLIMGLNVGMIYSATSTGLATDTLLTKLYYIVEKYYAETRATSQRINGTKCDKPSLLIPKSTSTFVVSDKSGESYTFPTEYYISIKDFLTYLTPFIKEFYGAKDGTSAYLRFTSDSEYFIWNEYDEPRSYPFLCFDKNLTQQPFSDLKCVTDIYSEDDIKLICYGQPVYIVVNYYDVSNYVATIGDKSEIPYALSQYVGLNFLPIIKCYDQETVVLCINGCEVDKLSHFPIDIACFTCYRSGWFDPVVITGHYAPKLGKCTIHTCNGSLPYLINKKKYDISNLSASELAELGTFSLSSHYVIMNNDERLLFPVAKDCKVFMTGEFIKNADGSISHFDIKDGGYLEAWTSIHCTDDTDLNIQITDGVVSAQHLESSYDVSQSKYTEQLLQEVIDGKIRFNYISGDYCYDVNVNLLDCRYDCESKVFLQSFNGTTPMEYDLTLYWDVESRYCYDIKIVPLFSYSINTPEYIDIDMSTYGFSLMSQQFVDDHVSFYPYNNVIDSNPIKLPSGIRRWFGYGLSIDTGIDGKFVSRGSDVQVNPSTTIKYQSTMDCKLKITSNSGYFYSTIKLLSNGKEVDLGSTTGDYEYSLKDGDVISFTITATSYIKEISIYDILPQFDCMNLMSYSLGTIFNRIRDTSDRVTLAGIICSYMAPDPEIISPTLLADSLAFLSQSLSESIELLLYSIEEALLSNEYVYDRTSDNLPLETMVYYRSANGDIAIGTIEEALVSSCPASNFLDPSVFNMTSGSHTITMPFVNSQGVITYSQFSSLLHIPLSADVNEVGSCPLWNIIANILTLDSTNVSGENKTDVTQLITNYTSALNTVVERLLDIYSEYGTTNFENTFSVIIDSISETDSKNLSIVNDYIDTSKEAILAKLEDGGDAIRSTIADGSSIAERLWTRSKNAIMSAASKVKATAQETYDRLGTVKSNVSCKVKSLSEAIVSGKDNVGSSLTRLLGLSSDSYAQGTGWDDESSISDVSSLSLALGCSVDLSAVPHVISSICTIIDKGVNWCYDKASKYITETIKDGVSFAVNPSGFETLSIAQYQRRMSKTEILKNYPQISEYFIQYCDDREQYNGIYLVCQVNSVLLFIQRLSEDSFLVSGNSLLDLGSPILDDQSSDLDFVDQMITSINRSIVDYNRVIDAYNNICHQITNYFFNIELNQYVKYDLVDRDEVYSRIFSGAYVNTVEAKAKPIKAWSWASIALGSLLCLTGVGTTVGSFLIAGGAGALAGAALAQTTSKDYSMEAILAKANEDDDFANANISSSELLGVWTDIPCGIFSVYLSLLDSILWPNAYVHCGAGAKFATVDANNLPYEAYIPMAINTGVPTFKYRILSDDERKQNTRFRLAVIVATTAAVIVSARLLTKGIRSKKRYKKLLMGQASLDKEILGTKKYAQQSAKYAMRINKVTSSMGTAASASTMSLLKMIEPEDTETIKTITDQLIPNLQQVNLDLIAFQDHLEVIEGNVMDVNESLIRLKDDISKEFVDIETKCDDIKHLIGEESDENALLGKLVILSSSMSALSNTLDLLSRTCNDLNLNDLLIKAYMKIGVSKEIAESLAKSFLSNGSPQI